MAIGFRKGVRVYLKRAILGLIERPVLGAPARALGALTRRRAKVMGLRNPFFVPAMVIERDRDGYIAPANSYLAIGSAPGQRVRLDPRVYEPEIAWLIGRLVRIGEHALDIGANVGLHTVAIARATAPGTVVAFEPVAAMAERLSTNCAFNGLANVVVMDCALGVRNETLTMRVNIAGAGMEGTSSLADSVHLRDHPERYAPLQVPVRRLDDVIVGLGLAGRIGFVKIDTEGFHTMIVEGGIETLRHHRPAMIIEAHSTRLKAAGHSFLWYRDTFPDHHVFIVYGITRANPFLRLEPLVAEPPEIAVNLLLLPRLKPRPGGA